MPDEVAPVGARGFLQGWAGGAGEERGGEWEGEGRRGEGSGMGGGGEEKWRGVEMRADESGQV